MSNRPDWLEIGTLVYLDPEEPMCVLCFTADDEVVCQTAAGAVGTWSQWDLTGYVDNLTHARRELATVEEQYARALQQFSPDDNAPESSG